MLLLLTSLASSRPTPCDDGFHDFLPCSSRGWTLNGPASYVDPTGMSYAASYRPSVDAFDSDSSPLADKTAMTSSSAIDRVVPHPDGSWFAATVNGVRGLSCNTSQS